MIKSQFLILSIIIAFSMLCINLSSQNLTLPSNDISNISDSEKVMMLVKKSEYYYTLSSDSSFKYAKQALALAKKCKNQVLIAKSYHVMGVSLYYKGEYETSLQNLFASLKISETLNHEKEIGALYNNIGNIYVIQGHYDQALDFYFRDLKICQQQNDKINEAKTLGNIGMIYDNKKNDDSALYYYQLGGKMSESLGDSVAFTNANINIGVVYQGKNKYDESIKYFLKALEIAELSNNNDALALININCGLSYLEINEFESSEKYLQKSVEICKRLGTKDYLIYCYKFLSELYSKKHDYKNSLEYFKISIQYKDSVFNEQKSKQIAEMQTIYDTEKKQKQIEIQNMQLDKQTLELNQKQIIIYAITFGLLLMLVLAIFIYRSYLQKKKANTIITMQNKSLEQANEEIRAQRDEIEAQRDMLNNQNEVLEEKNVKITDSINYAKYIQDAVLPSEQYMKLLINQYFILFKPKDIVSGDFYWVTKVNDWLIITVADCTGHGVPGAFMSMLGISFLNEIVRKQEVRQANQVLNQLRNSVIDSLKQTGNTEEQKDGMDISLIAIDTNSNKAQWAGANNPLWIVKSQKFIKTENNEEKLDKLSTFVLEELKPDKMPIAIYERMDDFTNHEINLNKGDVIYLFTDGFEDAIGGEKGKKFLSKNLKQLLYENSQKPMNEQKEIHEKTLIEWIGDGEQIDDITILGLKI